MNTSVKYLKDESGNIFSPVVNMKAIYTEEGKTLEEYIQTIISNTLDYSVPVGTIISSISNIPSTTGWLFCNGVTFDEIEYPKLYEYLGENKLPDLRNRFLYGAENLAYLTITGGEASHTLTVNEMPAHSHSQAGHNHSVYAPWGQQYCSKGNTGNDPKSSTGDGTHYTSTATPAIYNTGGSQAHNNMPPYYSILFYIKAK